MVLPAAAAGLPSFGFSDQTAQTANVRGTAGGSNTFRVSYGGGVPDWVWLAGIGLAFVFLLKKKK